MAESMQNGDAVASYALFARGSAVFSKERGLPEFMSLISLVEAAILYERIWYLPFGDETELKVTKTAMWSELSGTGICRLADGAPFREKSNALKEARNDFEQTVRALGSVPTYGDVGEAESLERAFDYGLRVNAPFIHVWDGTRDESMLTGLGVRTFIENVSGTGARQNEDRQLDWEKAASYVARSSVARCEGADYVGDAFEHPVAAMASLASSLNPAAKLYAKLAGEFAGKLKGLKDDGYPMALAIPPIAALVLDRSDGSLKSLVKELVALRAEFAAFRTRYRSYSEVLRNPSEGTLGELFDARLDAMSEVTAAINSVAEQRTDSTLMQGIIGGNIKPGGGEDGEALDIEPTVSLGGLAKVVIQKTKTRFIKGRAQILFDVWSKALQIRKYNQLAQRRLGIVLGNSDVRAYAAYARAIEQLVKPSRL